MVGPGLLGNIQKTYILPNLGNTYKKKGNKHFHCDWLKQGCHQAMRKSAELYLLPKINLKIIFFFNLRISGRVAALISMHMTLQFEQKVRDHSYQVVIRVRGERGDWNVSYLVVIIVLTLHTDLKILRSTVFLIRISSVSISIFIAN